MPKYPEYEEMDQLQGEGEKPMHKEPSTVDDKMHEDEEATAIVPMKVLMGKDGEEPNEGDEIVLKVVKKYGDEAEVAYAPAKPKEKPEMSGEMSANDELDSIGKEYA